MADLPSIEPRSDEDDVMPHTTVNVIVSDSVGQQVGGRRMRRNTNYYDIKDETARVLLQLSPLLWEELQLDMRISTSLTRTEGYMVIVFALLLIVPGSLGALMDPDGDLGNSSWFILLLLGYYCVLVAVIYKFTAKSDARILAKRREYLAAMEPRFREAGYEVEFFSSCDFPWGGIAYLEFTPVGVHSSGNATATPPGANDEDVANDGNEHLGVGTRHDEDSVLELV